MTSKDKIRELRQIIKLNLQRLVSNQVAIFGLPTHGNIGDTLISIGELEFLKDIGVECIYKRLLLDDNPRLPKLPKDCTILFQGGGDFGDVWRKIHENRLKIISNYPNNNIIIFPQSVHYNDNNLLIQDANFLSKFKKLTICARDEFSFDILSKNFRNKILLIPDMAFYIPTPITLNKFKTSSKHLYLKRTDKELVNLLNINIDNADISDWPTINNDLWQIKIVFKLIGLAAAFRIRRIFIVEKLLHHITSYYTIKWLYPHILKIGTEFITKYELLTLTRLHSAILATLLDKEFYLIDNAYGKNHNFYNTWLHNLEKAHIYN